jgi:hypothetical protein
MDNDGWLDILMSNGHVYPEVDKSNADLKYAEHKYLYRNLQNGRLKRSPTKADRAFWRTRRRAGAPSAITTTMAISTWR